MNEHLMEILGREIIKSLPSEKRELYEYVVTIEDELAQQANTKEEFMALLIEEGPHRQAAIHFNLTFNELMKKMQEIEIEINDRLEERMKNCTWIDFTDQVQELRGLVGEKSLYFYFSADHLVSK